MDQGRKMIYLYFMLNSTAWGVFIVLYTYYLEDVVTHDNETKSLALSTYRCAVARQTESVASGPCEAHRHGRALPRPRATRTVAPSHRSALLTRTDSHATPHLFRHLALTPTPTRTHERSTMVYSIVIFLMAPILGAMSDSLGRRIMLISGALLDAVTFFVWGTATNAYLWVWVSVLMGFDGSSLAGYTVMVDAAVVIPASMIGGPDDWWITRYVYWCARPVEYDLSKADLSTEINCAFILLNCLSILGLILGGILAEIVYYSAGIFWGMSSAGFVMLLSVVILYLYMPETLLAAQRKEFKLEMALEALTDQIKSVEMFTSSALLAALAVFYLFTSLFVMATWNVLLYWLEDKFSFAETQVEYLLLGVYFIIPPVAILINSRGFPAFGFERVFTVVYAISALGSLMTNFVTDNAWLYVVIYMQAGSWACYILVLGVATPLVGYEDAGRLQGAMYSISTIGSLVGTVGSYYLFDATYDDNYAAPVW